jgi:hypothetical protein
MWTLPQRFLAHAFSVSLYLMLLPLGLAGALSAEDSVPRQVWEKSRTRTTPGTFPPLRPCRVQYELSWNNLLSAGTASVLLQEAGEHQVAKAQAGTTGLARALWRYDCTMTSVIQRADLRAVYMEHSETDSRETASYQVHFDRHQIRTMTDLKPEGGTPQRKNSVCPLDEVDDLQSTILYVRSHPLRAGDSFTRVVQPFDRPYLTIFTVIGREKRKVQGTLYPTIKLDVKICRVERRTLALGSFKKMKTATIWVSDDAWRLPVEMHASIYVGFISATMTKREPLQDEAVQRSLPARMSRDP